MLILLVAEFGSTDSSTEIPCLSRTISWIISSNMEDVIVKAVCHSSSSPDQRFPY
jgi:hypothetical protein